MNTKAQQPYLGLFEVCTVPFCGRHQRGAKITCGRCGVIHTIAVNTWKGHGPNAEMEAYYATEKFRKDGWKVGKNAHQNRCPGCFSAIKIAATRKRKEELMNTTSKVVPIPTQTNGPPPIEEHRPMTRDERRIIFAKIDELYVGDKTGYVDGWSDARIASDLGVPRAWVSGLRDEYFGPEMNENAITDAKMLLVEIKNVELAAGPIVKQMNELAVRAEAIQRMLEGFTR